MNYEMPAVLITQQLHGSMEYLLDTNVCINIFRNTGHIREKIEKAGIAHCAVSEITIAELFYGAAKSGRAKHFQDVYNVMRLFQIVPTSDCLERYGVLKSQLEQSGMRIDDFDLLIGATALQHRMTLVTHNIKHLARIPQIQIEDWEE